MMDGPCPERVWVSLGDSCVRLRRWGEVAGQEQVAGCQGDFFFSPAEKEPRLPVSPGFARPRPLPQDGQASEDKHR